MIRISKKNLLLLVIASMMFAASFAIVYAESISTVVSAIVQRITIAFDAIGQDKIEASGKDMESTANNTMASINDMLNNAENELSNELSQYKDMRVNEKNQEIESMLRDINASVNQKKAEKLNQYKQKIDEKIEKEYEKLLKDLIQD